MRAKPQKILALASLVTLTALASFLDAHDAKACGAAYPAGTFVRLSSEQTVIVWDKANKTEHFIRKPVFEGDPKSFGFFVPTPTVPKIAKEKDELIGRVAALVPSLIAAGSKGGGGMPGSAVAAAPAVEVLQTVHVDDYEIVTLKATNADVLGEWLAKNGFVDRPSLRPWAQRYLAKGWVLNAMKYAGAPAGAHAEDGLVATPTLRFSFAIEEPFYPYTEAPPEKADEAAFHTKYGAVATPTHALDVYVVGDTAVAPYQGAKLAGPAVMNVGEATANTLVEALGETSGWDFDPKGRAGWKVTHLHEEVTERVAFDDIVFRQPDPRADALAEGTPIVDADPTYGTAIDPKKRAARFAFVIVFLAIVTGLVFATLAERNKL
jgi:hypothetical protein